MTTAPAELRFDKQHLFWFAIVGPAMTAGAGAMATAPTTVHGAIFTLLRALLGPAAVSLVFGAGSLLFAGGTVVIVNRLLSDGVAARITPDGIVVRGWRRSVTVGWGELWQVDREVKRYRGREYRWVRVQRRPADGGVAGRVIRLPEAQLLAGGGGHRRLGCRGEGGAGAGR